MDAQPIVVDSTQFGRAAYSVYRKALHDAGAPRLLSEHALPSNSGSPAAEEPLRRPTARPRQATFVLLAGTSIAGISMSPATVAAYRDAIDRALARGQVTLFARGEIDGSYDHADGTHVEEGTVVRAGTVASIKVATVRHDLTRIARDFRQEALGFIVHSCPGPPLLLSNTADPARSPLGHSPSVEAGSTRGEQGAASHRLRHEARESTPTKTIAKEKPSP